MHETPWAVDPVKVLTRREFATVLATLNAKASRLPQARMNHTVLRLACHAGLWGSEIAGLTLDDVRVDSTRPYIRVRPEIAKGGHVRTVPLWWDEGSLVDLREWKRERERRGARPSDAFVCRLWPKRDGSPLIQSHGPGAVSYDQQASRLGTALGPNRPPRPAHVRESRLGWWADVGRGQGGRGACVACLNVGVPARGGG